MSFRKKSSRSVDDSFDSVFAYSRLVNTLFESKLRVHQQSKNKLSLRRFTNLRLIFLCVTLVITLGACSLLRSEHILWVFEAPRSTQWGASGTATPPKILDDSIIYSGGYQWHNDIHVFAVDAKSGKQKWKTEKKVSNYIVDDKYVFALTQNLMYTVQPGKEREEELSALDVKTGEELWKLDLSKRSNELKLFSCNDHLVILNDTSDLRCLEKKTGALAWHSTLPIASSRVASIHPSVAVLEPRLYIAWPDGNIQIYEVSSGKLLSQFQLRATEFPLQRFIYVTGNYVCILDADGYLNVLLTDSRRIVGPLQSGFMTGAPVFDEKRIYLASGFPGSSDSKKIVENQKKSSEPDGKTSDEKRPSPSTDHAETDSRIQKSSDNGKGIASLSTAGVGSSMQNVELKYGISAIDMNSKSSVWNTEINGPVIDPLVKSGSYILASSTKGVVYCLRSNDGKVVWSKEVGEKAFGPAVKDGIAYVTGSNGLFAIMIDTGKVLWTVQPNQFAPSAGVVIKGDIAYMVAQDSNLYAIKTATIEQDNGSSKSAGSRGNATNSDAPKRATDPSASKTNIESASKEKSEKNEGASAEKKAEENEGANSKVDSLVDSGNVESENIEKNSAKSEEIQKQ